MSDDLTTRLREIQAHQRPFHVFLGEVPAETIYGEAADRIEALEAERDSFERLWKRLDTSSEKHFGNLIEDRIEAVESLESALTARDAVIAEALAATGLDYQAQVDNMREILSRVPQGAAEPRMLLTHPHDGHGPDDTCIDCAQGATEPSGCEVCAGVRILDGRPMHCEACGAPIKFAGTTCESAGTDETR